jgi:hypothetical protein
MVYKFKYFLMFAAGAGGHFIANQMIKNLYNADIAMSCRTSSNEWGDNDLLPWCVTQFMDEDISKDYTEQSCILLNHGWREEQWIKYQNQYQFDHKIFVLGNRFSTMLGKLKKTYGPYTDDSIGYLLEDILFGLRNTQISDRFDIDMLTNKSILSNALEDQHDILKIDHGAFIQPFYEYIFTETVNNRTVCADGFRKFLSQELVAMSLGKHYVDQQSVMRKIGESYCTDIEFVDYEDFFLSQKYKMPGVTSQALDQYNKNNFDLLLRILELVDTQTKNIVLDNLNVVSYIS